MAERHNFDLKAGRHLMREGFTIIRKHDGAQLHMLGHVILINEGPGFRVITKLEFNHMWHRATFKLPETKGNYEKESEVLHW